MNYGYQGSETASKVKYAEATGQAVGASLGDVARQSQTASALDNLSHCIGALDGLVQALEARLSPITRPVPPQAESANKSVPREVTVALAERINEGAAFADQIARRVDSLLNRLEV